MGEERSQGFCSEALRGGIPLTEMGGTVGGVARKWAEDKDQELSFGHSTFELLTRH